MDHARDEMKWERRKEPQERNLPPEKDICQLHNEALKVARKCMLQTFTLNRSIPLAGVVCTLHVYEWAIVSFTNYDWSFANAFPGTRARHTRKEHTNTQPLAKRVPVCLLFLLAFLLFSFWNYFCLGRCAGMCPCSSKESHKCMQQPQQQLNKQCTVSIWFVSSLVFLFFSVLCQRNNLDPH